MRSLVKVELSADEASFTVDGRPVSDRLRVIDIPVLTDSKVATDVFPLTSDKQRVIVRFERASQFARDRLFEQRIPWIGPNDELYLFGPEAYIERDPKPGPARSGQLSKPANYFSRRSSRVVRWLLNHPQDEPTIRSLARDVELSESTVSRAVDALARDLFVSLVENVADNREKRFRVLNGERLLQTWARVSEMKRVETVSWDVGTSDFPSTLDYFLKAAQMQDDQRAELDDTPQWCLGGLSGAAVVNKAVEPSALFAWIDRRQLNWWADVLMPAPRTVRQGDAFLTLGLAADPNLFDAATSEVDVASGIDLRIADPAQLYLDCWRAGERGLEAAVAMKDALNLGAGIAA